jgi:hypothetical protein
MGWSDWACLLVLIFLFFSGRCYLGRNGGREVGCWEEYNKKEENIYIYIYIYIYIIFKIK